MNIKKYILLTNTLLNNEKLRNFYSSSYGFELMLKIYDQNQDETNMHIDKLYSSLKSGLPRREAFGQYINRLQKSNNIKKIPHSQKKSMKSIVLSEDIITELNKVFEL
jgi:hypothetical protein